MGKIYMKSGVIRNNETVKAKSLYKEAIGRFFRHKLGVTGLIVIVFIVIISIFAPFIAPYDPAKIDADNVLIKPSKLHLFGTDELGRDVFSRIIYGARISIFVMITSIGLAIIAGTIIGLIAGFFGKIADTIIMRITDAMLAFPTIIMALVVIAILGPSIRNTTIAIAITNVPKFVRIVRGQVLTIKESEYVSAAKAIGCKNNYIMLKEILPNCLDVIIIYATLLSGHAIIVESSLSFLGLGVQPPTPSWGWMIVVAMKYWSKAWWMPIFPGVAIFITVLSINFIGDALRDAFDTKLKM
jgi:peptide/nickel transport system permease protein